MEVAFTMPQAAAVNRHSANTVAVGYPASVARSAGNGIARFGEYSYAAAAALLRPVETGMARALSGLVANKTRHPANFVALPSASCRDGAFDVLELHAGYLAQIAHSTLGPLPSRVLQPRHPATVLRLSALADIQVEFAR
jgi:hypothetical protein